MLFCVLVVDADVAGLFDAMVVLVMVILVVVVCVVVFSLVFPHSGCFDTFPDCYVLGQGCWGLRVKFLASDEPTYKSLVS